MAADWWIETVKRPILSLFLSTAGITVMAFLLVCISMVMPEQAPKAGWQGKAGMMLSFITAKSHFINHYL